MSTDKNYREQLSDVVQVLPESGTLLINAGLPWTNPLKLQIGSEEHIIDTTINRRTDDAAKQ